MTLAPDFVTILSSADGKLMVKRHGIRDGQEVTRGYDNSYHIVSRRVPVWNVANLADVLENVDQRSCVIWGQHVAGLDSTQPHRRIARDKTDGDIVEPARYEDAAHRYLLLDLDGTESVPDWQVPLGQDKLDARVLDMLPPELHGIRCWYALSASAGLGQRDRVKLRLAFWLNRSITGDEARKRLGQTGSDGKRLWPAIDLSIYAAAQPIYIAPPRFEDGRVDPLGSDGIPGWKGLKRSDHLCFREGFVPIHGRFGGRTPEEDAAAGGAWEACVPEIEPPPPREQQRSTPEGLEESDDDPALITVLRRQIDWFKNTHDIGTSPGGGRVFKLACWLQKIRVGNKIITQAACRDILEEHYRDVTNEVVANAAATIGEKRGSVDITLHHDPAGRFGGPTMDELIRRVNEIAPPGADYTSAEFWEATEFPPCNPILGGLLHSTSRMLLVAPTGLGKTHFAMAIGGAIAAGKDFLHWRVSQPKRVLYIDGEMPRGLMQRRFREMIQRMGLNEVEKTTFRANFSIFNREVLELADIDFPPLNTVEGQMFVDAWIKAHGGVDLVILDNIQSLLVGEHTAESWLPCKPWVLSLGQRQIAQIWVHHANDQGTTFGDKTREWGMSTVMLMKKPEGADDEAIRFDIAFKKARERVPGENSDDFRPAQISLQGNIWRSNEGATSSNLASFYRMLIRDTLTQRALTRPVKDLELANLLSEEKGTQHPDTQKTVTQLHNLHKGASGQTAMAGVGRVINGTWHWQLQEFWDRRE